MHQQLHRCNVIITFAQQQVICECEKFRQIRSVCWRCNHIKISEILNKEELLKETTFRASRSGGKGGQNVNKISSRVEMIFNVAASSLFAADEKILLLDKLTARLNRDGAIHVVCDAERSQFLNREMALERLHHIILKAFEKPKPRKPTKISKAAKARRTEQKQLHSAKKESRRSGFGH